MIRARIWLGALSRLVDDTLDDRVDAARRPGEVYRPYERSMPSLSRTTKRSVTSQKTVLSATHTIVPA
jgi:hypothetical protein